MDAWHQQIARGACATAASTAAAMARLYLMTGTINDMRRHDVRGVGICCVSRAYRFVLLSIEAEALACLRVRA